MSTELPRFRFLAVTGGEGMDFTAPFVGELERHVSQSTDANDPDTSGGGQFMNQEWRKYCDAAHRSGPTFARSSASGKGRTHGHWARTRSAKPPCRPTMVPRSEERRVGKERR